jgi:histidine ammonia-lyase
MTSCVLDGNSLTLHKVYEVAARHQPVKLSRHAIRRMMASRSLVEQWLSSSETVYGVTTGFGEFANVRITPQNIEYLQENLILSHAGGAGEPIPPEVVRAMMLLRANALAKGYSGVRPQTVELLISMLNAGIVPVVPSQGSVGSSGDLVPLSHMVYAMMGKGEVWKEGNGREEAGRALRRAHLKPVRLGAKEGLALINGTQMMTAYASLAVHRAQRLVKMADIAGAMSVEALRGSDTPYDERIHRVRPFKGQRSVARNMRAMMKGSLLRESHRRYDPRVQDAYSLRCIPQVHGASRDTLAHVAAIVSIEINSANDNPLIFPDDGVHLEGGNFHGQPIALALDFLAIALSELASISERRIERLVNGNLSGLPRFLTSRGGLHSGLMIAQYTAASIVSENKVLCHPASVDSIPTSANQEDHNSMGSIAAQKAWKVLQNVETVIGLELLCACQGLDFARTLNGLPALSAGRGTEAAYRFIRRRISHMDEDRYLFEDIQRARALVENASLLEAVESSIGKLA